MGRNKGLRRERIGPTNDSNDLEAVRVAHQPRGKITSDGVDRGDDRFVTRRTTMIRFSVYVLTYTIRATDTDIDTPGSRYAR